MIAGDADAASDAPAVHRLTLRAGGREVPLRAGPGALDELSQVLSASGFKGRLFVVADRYAFELYGPQVRRALPASPVLTIEGDEVHKTVDQVSAVWDWLVDREVERRDALVAFGGGVVCDLVGFAAASYLRGVGVVNVPTTLLAQVDASVGGKTGVNHVRGKNLIGAFYQPLAVVADTSLLASLPQRAFAAGMAEVAKMAMILDGALFERLELLAHSLHPHAAVLLAPIVARSIELKATIVEHDERERGERMLLNYGHTVGHAIEAASGYGTLLHGESVAIGMRAASHIATSMGILAEDAATRQARLLAALHLPDRSDATTTEDVLARLSLDKKREGARQRWVLAERIGSAQIRDDVPPDLAREAVRLVLGR